MRIICLVAALSAALGCADVGNPVGPSQSPAVSAQSLPDAPASAAGEATFRSYRGVLFNMYPHNVTDGDEVTLRKGRGTAYWSAEATRSALLVEHRREPRLALLARLA